MCFLVLLGAAFPRLALFFTWLFSDRISAAIESNFAAFLGFLFLPFTTFFYVVAWSPVGHVSGFGWIIVTLGLLLDLGSYSGGGTYANKRRSS